MSALFIGLIAVCVLLSAALLYGLWWVIVKWIMSDAPANTHFAGIKNYEQKETETYTPPPGQYR